MVKNLTHLGFTILKQKELFNLQGLKLKNR